MKGHLGKNIDIIYKERVFRIIKLMIWWGIYLELYLLEGSFTNYNKLMVRFFTLLFLPYETVSIHWANAVAWMFVSPQNSYVENLTSKMITVRSRAFGKWLDHGGRALMNRISPLKKKLPCVSSKDTTIRHHLWTRG